MSATSPKSTAHFLQVTELTGAEISREQWERMCHRYYWAGSYCDDRDVLEAGCGAGQGLSYLLGRAQSLKGGDYSLEVVSSLPPSLRGRVGVQVFDCQQMPFPDDSFDVVILFEAIYYLASAERFVQEARRVLRRNGTLLIASANKDLYDFNPSPHSCTYYGVVEMRNLLQSNGFDPTFFGYFPADSVSLRQRFLRPMKAIAVKLNLVPKTMEGKRLLKRLVFGQMMPLPEQMSDEVAAKDYVAPSLVSSNLPDRTHKVIYCAARLL